MKSKVLHSGCSCLRGDIFTAWFDIMLLQCKVIDSVPSKKGAEWTCSTGRGCGGRGYHTCFVGAMPAAAMSGLMALLICSWSSVSHRLGTSPLLRMLLMSSRKDS
jgi:hypothetical protein